MKFQKISVQRIAPAQTKPRPTMKMVTIPKITPISGMIGYVRLSNAFGTT